jgi:hypothetical protein
MDLSYRYTIYAGNTWEYTTHYRDVAIRIIKEMKGLGWAGKITFKVESL